MRSAKGAAARPQSVKEHRCSSGGVPNRATVLRVLLRVLPAAALGLVLAMSPGLAQEPAAGTAAKQPLEHFIGTVTAVDQVAATVTVKEDKTGTDHTVLLANTRTLLKVEPGAKDLKSATRITANDLAVGDRVDVRGLKPEDNSNPTALAARSVVLMSGRDLQQAHEQQAAAWRQSTSGVVTTVNGGAGELGITSRTPEGPKQIVIKTSTTTEFTRYSPENSKTPSPSQFAQIQVGDQVRVLGEKSPDGASINAQKVYSGAFRTFSATISSIGQDGKSIAVKDLATKRPVEIALNDDSTIRKLPPMMAMMLARRLNPSYRPEGVTAGGGPPAGNGPAPGADGQGPSPRSANGGSAESTAAGGPGQWNGRGGPGGSMRGNGDVSQMIERVPKISLSDLKPGDAVVVSGVATDVDNSRLLATNVIAGVEPILQSAPQRQGAQSLGGDWGLGEMSVPQ